MTYAGYGFVGTVRPFRTEFVNEAFGGGVDPGNLNLDQGFFANSDTNGVDLDVTYRPTWQPLHAFSIHGQLTYQESTFSNVSTGVITAGGVNISQQVDTFYNGKVPPETPSQMYTITPQYDLPNHLGKSICATSTRAGSTRTRRRAGAAGLRRARPGRQSST